MLMKTLKIVSVFLAIILALSIVTYVAIAWNDIPFDSEAKKAAPGNFAKLSAGEIHYQWFKPSEEVYNGEIIVMSHGYGVPGFMFNQIAEMLTNVGHSVLIFDHFGHGYSDRPNIAYSSDVFEREVFELLEFLNINEPVTLIGQSMGGLIAANFAANHSSKVKKLVLFVPAGLRMFESEDKNLINLLKTPILGKWIWRVFGRAAMKEPDSPPCDLCGKGKIDGDLYEQAKYEGFFESMRDILVQFPMNKQDSVYKKLGDKKIPTLAIFGEKDDLVMPKSAKLFKSLVPNASVNLMENGDHALHIRHWEKIGAQVVDWLKK